MNAANDFVGNVLFNGSHFLSQHHPQGHDGSWTHFNVLGFDVLVMFCLSCKCFCPNGRFPIWGSFSMSSFSTGCFVHCHDAWAVGSCQVRSACMPRWQPCVRAQATLYKKKHYLPVMKATNSDSKRCQVSVDVSLQSPSCFQRKKARTFSSQAKGGRPHRLLLGGVQSKQRRNHLCGGNVLMYAANFQYLVVTTADHGSLVRGFANGVTWFILVIPLVSFAASSLWILLFEFHLCARTFQHKFLLSRQWHDTPTLWHIIWRLRRKRFLHTDLFWSTGMLPCETVSNILTPWSLLLLVSVLHTEKCTNKTCAGWILCIAGYYVPLLGHLVTWIGRCRGMKSLTIGMSEWNFWQLVMAWKHGLLCAWDNIGNFLTMFPLCQKAMGCSSIELAPRTCSTSWPPCLQLGLNDSIFLQAQTNRKLATLCPRHGLLD